MIISPLALSVINILNAVELSWQGKWHFCPVSGNSSRRYIAFSIPKIDCIVIMNATTRIAPVMDFPWPPIWLKAYDPGKLSRGNLIATERRTGNIWMSPAIPAWRRSSSSLRPRLNEALTGLGSIFLDISKIMANFVISLRKWGQF